MRKMLLIDDFVTGFSDTFPGQKELQPWEVTENLPEILYQLISQLGPDYKVSGGIAVHEGATIEKGAVLKAPILIGENCFVGSNAYLRGGVFLAQSAVIGPCCEIKTSIIFRNSSVAHFNFIGDSIIGNQVNFEAGSLTANHYNERADKKIAVQIDSIRVDTGVEKFGALVGDHSKIGANAVLSPGTILKPNSVVGRLALIEQNKKG